MDNTQRNAEDGQSHPSESTMRSRIKCNSSAISKEIKSEAQFCRTAQNDLYCSPNRKNDYNVFLSIVTSREQGSEIDPETMRLQAVGAIRGDGVPFA